MPFYRIVTIGLPDLVSTSGCESQVASLHPYSPGPASCSAGSRKPEHDANFLDSPVTAIPNRVPYAISFGMLLARNRQPHSLQVHREYFNRRIGLLNYVDKRHDVVWPLYRWLERFAIQIKTARVITILLLRITQVRAK